MTQFCTLRTVRNWAPESPWYLHVRIGSSGKSHHATTKPFKAVLAYSRRLFCVRLPSIALTCFNVLKGHLTHKKKVICISYRLPWNLHSWHNVLKYKKDGSMDEILLSTRLAGREDQPRFFLLAILSFILLDKITKKPLICQIIAFATLRTKYITHLVTDVICILCKMCFYIMSQM